MKISYFFRHPSPDFHSIEEQFFIMQKELPENVKYTNVFAKFYSKGLFRRLFITVQAAFNQGNINHITGDIHFVALFFKKKKTILTVHDIGSVIKSEAGSREPEAPIRDTRSRGKGRKDRESETPFRGKGRQGRGSLRKSEANSRMFSSNLGLKGKILRYFWFVMPFTRVKYVTVISEFTKQEILQNFKIKSEKIMVIPDCVSPEILFSEKEFDAEKPNILQIGTKSNKNLERLIPALNGLSCKLTIVGKLSGEQTALLEEHKIDYENFLNLDYSKIINLYKNTDLLTFVSTYEGFGVPVLEAQATGRPVLTSNISPMKEVSGEGALLVDPYDIQAIRSGIKQITEDKKLRQDLIKKGKENIKNYSAKAVAERYADLYRRVKDL